MKAFRLFILATALATICLFTPQANAQGIDGPALTQTTSLISGTVSLAHEALTSFYAPAGVIAVRSLDSASTPTAVVLVRLFAEAPTSGDLDGSTREKSGVAVRAGETLLLRLDRPRYVGVYASDGASLISAHLVE